MGTSTTLRSIRASRPATKSVAASRSSRAWVTTVRRRNTGKRWPSSATRESSPRARCRLSLGFEGRAGNTLKFGAEGFYKWLDNRIVGTPGGVAPHFVNDGEGRIYGAEFSTEYRPGPNTFGYLAYTISRSERRDGDGPVSPVRSRSAAHLVARARPKPGPRLDRRRSLPIGQR